MPELWFERLNRRTGLPRWAGAVCFGAGPFILLAFPIAALYGDPIVLGSTAIALVVSYFTFYTTRYLRRVIVNLGEYTNEMSDEPAGWPEALELSHFASLRRILGVWVIQLVLVVPLFLFGAPGSLVANFISEIPFLWFNFVLGTFFWTFGFSMYSIYKMGNMPLKLKPYTQDKTLGLKRFASASLNFTLIYFMVVTSVVVPILFGGAIPFELALVFLTFYPLGLLLFLFPLRSLHAKLVEAKAKELAWLEPRATAVLKRLKSEEGNQIGQDIVNELTAIDKIERDISSIRTWPFDTGIIVRLSAIIFSLVAIMGAKILQIAVGIK